MANWGSSDDWGIRESSPPKESSQAPPESNDWGIRESSPPKESGQAPPESNDWGIRESSHPKESSQAPPESNDWGIRESSPPKDSSQAPPEFNDWGIPTSPPSSNSRQGQNRSDNWRTSSSSPARQPRQNFSRPGDRVGSPPKRPKQDSSNQWNDSESPPSKRPRPEGNDPPPAPYRPEDLNLEEEAQLLGGAGENFSKYDKIKVTCFPDTVTPVDKFEDIIDSELLLNNIKNLKYDAMTPIQKWAMPIIMKGKDLIGCAQTGSGKTAAFLLPVLQTLLRSELDPYDPNKDCQTPHCLIISPTRELANQTHVQATMLSKDSMVKCVVIYGQISTAHLKAKLTQGCHILVATPGRLKDFIQRRWISFEKIKYIILDEGDRLVDDGFRSDINGFFNHESMPPKDQIQTLFFSATFKKETQVSAREYLKDTFVFLTVGRVGAANEDIKQEFIQISKDQKKRELKTILNQVPQDEKTIIFTQTKYAADMLAGFFTALGLSSTSIHGDRLQSQREQAIKAFRKGEKRFLISSPVGNRGLDLPKVALVINYDLPENIDEYVHRIGRTGRAGHTGRAISFYDEQRDRELLPKLVEMLQDAKQEPPSWMGEILSAPAPDNDAGASDWALGTQSEPAPAKDGEDSGKGAQPALAQDSGFSNGNDDWGIAGEGW